MKEKLEDLRIDLVEINSRVNRSIDTVDLALQHLEGEEAPFAEITNAYWKDGKIVVEFEANVDIDILYGFGDKVFSVASNVEEFDQSTGEFAIGVGKYDKPWWVQVVGEEVESEPFNVGPFQEGSDTEKEETDFWHSLWDSPNYSGDEFNTEKVTDFNPAKEVLGRGKNCILSLSHRWKGKTRQQCKSMIAWMSDEIKQLDPKRTIILIQDEPLSGTHGFTKENMDFLYTEFKEKLPDYQFGFSHTIGTMNDRELPDSDFVMLATYPFLQKDFHDRGIDDKASFDRWFDKRIEIAREKTDSDIYILGQGFYNYPDTNKSGGRWREPLANAPQWYKSSVLRNGCKGLIWWLYNTSRDDTVPLRKMPEFFKDIKGL